MAENLGVPNYASQLNKVLLQIGATEEGKKQMRQENMERLKQEFQFVDPYIQASLLQSVIYLTEEQFESIKEDYKELIEIGKSSSNDWVRQVSFLFQDYPNFYETIEYGEHTKIDFDSLSPIMLRNNYGISIISEDNLNNCQNNNYSINSIDPPSQSYQLCSLSDQELTKNHFASAPPKRTLEKNAHIFSTTQQKIAPRITVPPPQPSYPKQHKVQHDFNEHRLKPNPEKKKSQTTLFQAFNNH